MIDKHFPFMTNDMYEKKDVKRYRKRISIRKEAADSNKILIKHFSHNAITLYFNE